MPDIPGAATIRHRIWWRRRIGSAAAAATAVVLSDVHTHTQSLHKVCTARRMRHRHRIINNTPHKPCRGTPHSSKPRSQASSNKQQPPRRRLAGGRAVQPSRAAIVTAACSESGTQDRWQSDETRWQQQQPPPPPVAAKRGPGKLHGKIVFPVGGEGVHSTGSPCRSECGMWRNFRATQRATAKRVRHVQYYIV